MLLLAVVQQPLCYSALQLKLTFTFYDLDDHSSLFCFADEHEVDVIGYGGASDDDHSSVRSGTSDGGVTVTTWRQLSIGGDA